MSIIKKIMKVIFWLFVAVVIMTGSNGLYEKVGSGSGKVRVQEQETPMIKGVVYNINSKTLIARENVQSEILVVKNEYSDRPEAMFITIEEGDEIVDYKGNAFDLDDLEIGMFVASYWDGAVDDSYPAQAGTDRFVVYKNVGKVEREQLYLSQSMHFLNKDRTYAIDLESLDMTFQDRYGAKVITKVPEEVTRFYEEISETGFYGLIQEGKMILGFDEVEEQITFESKGRTDIYDTKRAEWSLGTCPDYMPWDIDHPFFGVEPGPIEEPDLLQYLWAEYIDPCYESVMEMSGFESGKAIDPKHVIIYSGRRYMAKYGAKEFKDQTTFFKNIPTEKVLDLAKRYFDIEEMDLTGVDEFTYDRELDTFFISPTGTQSTSRYNSRSRYSDKREFENAYLHDNGDITVELNSYHHDSDVLDFSYQLSLTNWKDRTGEYYFKSGRDEMHIEEVVEIEGDYKETDIFEDYTNDKGQLTVYFDHLLETDDSIVMVEENYYSDYSRKIIRFDKKTGEFDEDQVIDCTFEDEYCYVRTIDYDDYGRVMEVRSSQEIKLYDDGFTLIDVIELPEYLTELIQGGGLHYNGYGDYYDYNFDVSKDFRYFTYANDDGVFLYDSALNEEKKISMDIRIKSDNEGESHRSVFYLKPTFVGGSNVMASGVAPGMYYPVLYYNMDLDQSIHYGQIYDDTGIIRDEDDSYIRILSEVIFDWYEDVSGYDRLLLDLTTGELLEDREFGTDPTFWRKDGYNLHSRSGDSGAVFYDVDESDADQHVYRFINDAEEISEPLTIREGYVSVLFCYPDEEGVIQVVIHFDSRYNHRGFIVWDTGLKAVEP